MLATATGLGAAIAVGIAERQIFQAVKDTTIATVDKIKEWSKSRPVNPQNCTIQDYERVLFDPTSFMTHMAILGGKYRIFKKRYPDTTFAIKIEPDPTTGKNSRFISNGFINWCLQSVSTFILGDKEVKIDDLRPTLLKFFEWNSLENPAVRRICELALIGFQALQHNCQAQEPSLHSRTYVQLQSYIDLIQTMLGGKEKTINKLLDDDINKGCFPGKEQPFDKEATFDDFMRSKLQLVWLARVTNKMDEALVALEDQITPINPEGDRISYVATTLHQLDQETANLDGVREVALLDLKLRYNHLEKWMSEELKGLTIINQLVLNIAERNRLESELIRGPLPRTRSNLQELGKEEGKGADSDGPPSCAAAAAVPSDSSKILSDNPENLPVALPPGQSRPESTVEPLSCAAAVVPTNPSQVLADPPDDLPVAMPVARSRSERL